MPISHQYKIIFIHIPKTGGTSVEYALGIHGEISYVGLLPYLNQAYNEETLFGKGAQHFTANEIKKKVGRKIFEQYYKFTIVRNPYERLVSTFAWMNGKWYKKEKLTKKDFKESVLKIDKIYLKNRHLLPQYLFLVKKRKKQLFNDIKVIYYENLVKEVNELFQLKGINVKLEKRMVSNHDNYLDYYDEELIKIVNNLYSEDFNIFGYEKK